MYTDLSHLLRLLIGPGGRYYVSHGSLAEIMTYYVWRSYYAQAGWIPSQRTINGMCEGSTRVSHLMVNYYCGKEGRNALCSDLCDLMRSNVSIVGVHDSYRRIHDWTATLDMPVDMYNDIERKYMENASVADMAQYISEVMCYVLAEVE